MLPAASTCCSAWVDQQPRIVAFRLGERTDDLGRQRRGKAIGRRRLGPDQHDRAIAKQHRLPAAGDVAEERRRVARRVAIGGPRVEPFANQQGAHRHRVGDPGGRRRARRRFCWCKHRRSS